jgi:hypothetical protein
MGGRFGPLSVQRRRDELLERVGEGHAARSDDDLVACGQEVRRLDPFSIDEGAVPGPQIANPPFSPLKIDLGVLSAGSLVRNRNFVGRSASDDERTNFFQPKYVRPAISLANYEVGRWAVWLHRGQREIH